ncbi:EpsG family protein [Limosilactobacillus reuteri]|uniref:EpsG family protein n=1 Tax=Limosilactobacillus reuteri TaxID=1598 RepID=UPI001E32E3CB|nr:EpsG family protein [Limosilactobacillus reuteri]MCC4404978.1 EpsG family protein [Limosilactobacillus reuteri]
MFIYLATYLSSLLFIMMAERYEILLANSQRILVRLPYYLLIFIALLVPAILAGVRDYSVGTDVMVYGNAWFYRAFTVDYKTYINWATSSSVGSGYAFLNYVVSRFTNNPHVFYFIYNFLENILIFLGIRHFKKNINVTLGMATYYFLFFNVLLNILRQGMALALIVWGFKYVTDKKFVKYILVVAIATLFHNTAILAVVIYLVYLIFSDIKRLSILKDLFVLSIVMLILLLFTQFTTLLYSNSLLSDRYQSFVSSSSVKGGFWGHLLLCVPVLILYVLNMIYNKKISGIGKGFNYLVVVTTLMSIFNIYSSNLSRVTLYFDFLFIILIPYITKNGLPRIKWRNMDVKFILVIIYLFIYWWLIFVVMQSGETVPFVFMS